MEAAFLGQLIARPRADGSEVLLQFRCVGNCPLQLVEYPVPARRQTVDWFGLYPARRASGKGHWDPPKHATCRGWPIYEYPTYSAFWSVLGVRCLRMQRLASAMGFRTTARLGPAKNLPYSGVTPEP